MSDFELQKFPGWISGSGRTFGVIRAPIEKLAQLLDVPYGVDHSHKFIWKRSQLIGLFVLAGDEREDAAAAEIWVENSCKKADAFCALAEEIIVHLTEDVAVFLEDERDIAKRLNLKPPRQ